jgi:hypothetical protein
LPGNAGNFTWISTSTTAAKKEQTAVIIFMDSHRGVMLLKSVIWNAHPIRSRKLITETRIINIHTIICNEYGRPSEYQRDLII